MLKPSTGWSFPTTGGRLLLDPTGEVGGGAAPVPAPAPSPAPPSPATPPAAEPNRSQLAPPSASGRDADFANDFRPPELQPSGGAAPATPPAAQGGQAPAAPAPADPNNQWQTVRDAAGRMGYQFGPDVKDDAAALQHLVAAARQAQQSQQFDYHRELGRRLAPHSQAIQSYLQQQQAPQQQAPPGRQPWEAPEWNPQWKHLVEVDPATNAILAKPGAPPEIADKVSAYVKWREEYDANPAAMIEKMVEAKAEAIADRRFQQNFAAREQQTQIQTIMQNNADWFYAKDQNGQFAQDQNGRPQVTPVGAAYLQHLQAVKAAGVTNPALQDQFAKQLTHAQLLISQAGKTQQAAPTNQPTAQAYQVPPVNAAQVMQPGAVNPPAGYTPPSMAGLSLRDAMAREMAAAGISDADIARDFRG